MKYSQYKYNRGKYSTADLEEGASTVSVTSGVANVNVVRVRTSGALAASTTVIVTESFTTVAGAATSSSTVTTTSVGEKISLGAATSTVASTIASAGQRLALGGATSSTQNLQILNVCKIVCKCVIEQEVHTKIQLQELHMQQI